jgi:3-oxosteroid 1-dehydrogenase
MKAENKRDRLTRRNFIKTAAVSAGSAALAGVGSKEAASAQQSQVSKWDYEAEVVVLGIGGAGLTSAIAARDLGADLWHMANVCGTVLSFKAPGCEWAFGA